MTDFETLVRQHQGAVCATAYAVLRDRARSEDIAQDAFLIAWRKLPELSPPPPLPAWICGIARNLARNAVRKRKEVAMPDGHEPAATATPLGDALAREDRELAERALAELTESDREIVVLYYRGEQSFAEVAAVLGITEATARQRVHRSRQRLRSAVTAVETTLRATRPGTAFTAACVAAFAAGTVPDASAAGLATKPAVATTTLLAIGGALLVAAGIVVGLALDRSGDRPPPQRAPSSASAAPGAGPAGSQAAAPTATPAELVRRIARAERDARIARFRAAHAVPATPTADTVKVFDFADVRLEDPGALPPPPPPGPLTKRSLRYAIQLLQPVLLECKRPAQVRAGTKLVIRMRLVGDPTAGSVAESIEITSDPPLDVPAYVDCLHDVLATIELPPLPDADAWDVHYPFVVDGAP